MKTRSELDWLAFQYIAGELDAESSTQFESRLAVDLTACEAVARAVQLAEVSALAESRISIDAVSPASTATVSGVHWTRRLAWMACGAAACLLFVLLARPFHAGLRLTTSDGRPGGGGSVEADSDLALAWAQTRDSVVAEEAAELADSSADGEREEATDTSLVAPSWMLAAVVGLNADPEENEVRREIE